MNWIDMAGIYFCLASVPLGVLAGRYIQKAAQSQTPLKPGVFTPDLNTPEMRERLRTLLDHYGIKGDCDIRDGQVFRALRAGETSSMAAVLMGIYNREVERLHNPNLMLCIPRGDGSFLPLGLDLSHLREIAQMLENTSGR